VALLAKELMIKNFFTRTFVLDDELRGVRQLTLTYKEDPSRLPLLRERLQGATRNVILLNEVLDYISEALEQTKLPPKPPSGPGRDMYGRLQLDVMLSDLLLRVKDLRKLMEGAYNKVGAAFVLCLRLVLFCPVLSLLCVCVLPRLVCESLASNCRGGEVPDCVVAFLVGAHPAVAGIFD